MRFTPPLDPPIPVVVITESTDSVCFAVARDAGAVAILPKLTDFDDLGRRVSFQEISLLKGTKTSP